MRRTFPAIIPALLLTLAACGGGDDGATDDVDTPDATAGPSTSLPAPVAVDGCEDEPDPADADSEVPQAVRPCETPTALDIHVIREGTGRNAEDGDTVMVDYVGIRAEDGVIVDESYTRPIPLEFPLGRGGVIEGWDDGLIGLQAGSRVKLDVPAELAYADNPPAGDDVLIQPGDALSFVIDVRAVIAPVTAADAPLDLQIEPSIGATEVTVTELESGAGEPAEIGDTVVVHVLLVRGDNEVVLLNSWEESDVVKVPLGENRAIPGLDGLFEGLEGARVGSRLVIAMPPEDAFGEEGNPTLGLPAGTDLIAVVDVVGIY